MMDKRLTCDRLGPAFDKGERTAMRGQRFGRVPCALAIVFLFGVTNAAADSVGTVTKVVNQAQIGSNTAVSGIPVYGIPVE